MNVTEILVIRYSGLGDIVMLLQTLDKLKQKYKNSYITLLCDANNAPIYKNSCSLIDRVIPINRKVFKEKKIISVLKELKNLYTAIRSNRYDLVIDFQNFGETATISYLSKSPLKIGAPKKSKYNYGYTKIVPRDERGHRSQFFSRIAGVDDSLDYSKLCLCNEGENLRNSLLRTKQDRKIVGLNIGSTQESRRWDEKNFLKLAEHLSDEYEISVFIGPSEKKFSHLFSKFRVFDELSIDQLCGAISCCDYFISNDTGPVHIAAALNVATLTLFSTGDDENVGALTDKKTYIRKNPINDIKVEEVIEKLYSLKSLSE